MGGNPFTLALITGASSGIGEALAHLLSSKGIPLIVSGRDDEKLLALKHALEVETTVCVADLALRRDRDRLIALICDKQPDLVINNAGYGLYGDALSHPTAAELGILEVNGNALLELTLEAVRGLKENHRSGVVLNVSSVAAFQIFPGQTVYAASKAFVNAFSESLDEELKEHGIRILAACPGRVATQFGKRAAQGKERPKRASAMVMTPQYAAEQIWWQIVHRKPVHTFDWKYRFLSFLTRNWVPKSIITRALASFRGKKG